MNILAKLKETFQKKKASEAMLQEILATANQLGFSVYYKDLAHTTGRMAIEHLRGEVTDLRIELVDTVPIERQILTIAHELGHASQFLGECDADITEWGIYQEVNDMMTIEIDAWLRAVLILHQIGWSDWRAFKDLALWSLSTYVVHLNKDKVTSMQEIDEALHREGRKAARLLDVEITRITEREVVYA